MEAPTARRRVLTLLSGFAIGVVAWSLPGLAFILGFFLGYAPVVVAAVAVLVLSVAKGWFDLLSGYVLGFGLVFAWIVGRMVANGATEGNDPGWMVFGLAVVLIGALSVIAGRRRSGTIARPPNHPVL